MVKPTRRRSRVAHESLTDPSVGSPLAPGRRVYPRVYPVYSILDRDRPAAPKRLHPIYRPRRASPPALRQWRGAHLQGRRGVGGLDPSWWTPTVRSTGCPRWDRRSRRRLGGGGAPTTFGLTRARRLDAERIQRKHTEPESHRRRATLQHSVLLGYQVCRMPSAPRTLTSPLLRGVKCAAWIRSRRAFVSPSAQSLRASPASRTRSLEPSLFQSARPLSTPAVRRRCRDWRSRSLRRTAPLVRHRRERPRWFSTPCEREESRGPQGRPLVPSATRQRPQRRPQADDRPRSSRRAPNCVQRKNAPRGLGPRVRREALAARLVRRLTQGTWQHRHGCWHLDLRARRETRAVLRRRPPRHGKVVCRATLGPRRSTSEAARQAGE